MNPSIERTELSLAINEIDTHCDVSIAMDACRYYGLNPQQGDAPLTHVRRVVAQWRDEAEKLQIPRSEQQLIASAFYT